MKTADLIGPALDWAVAKLHGFTLTTDGICMLLERGDELFHVLGPGASHLNYSPSTDWREGGPIIERERINFYFYDVDEDGEPNSGWDACYFGESMVSGPTPLIAAMRCFVASKLGDEVDIPKELL